MQSSKIHAKITVRAEYFGGVADDPMIVRAMWHDGWELVSHTPNPHMKPEAIISQIKEFFGVHTNLINNNCKLNIPVIKN